ncbi:MAG: glycosyltransferase family 1 protein [Anaerolineae bacterium]
MTNAPLRVCIDVSAAVHRRAGLGRYTHELVKGLVDLSLPDRVLEDAERFNRHAVGPRGEDAAQEPLRITAFYHQRGEAHLDPPIDQLPRRTTRLSVRPWRLLTALAYFSGVSQDRLFGNADIFHATEHLLPRLRHIRSVFTLHDLIFQFDPDSHKPLNIAFLKTLMPRFLRAADAIIAVSECSKRDAINLYQVDPSKIHVIYEGVDAHFAPVTAPDRLATVRSKYHLPERFIVHVGTIEPRKNLPLLFDVIANSNQHLVVAGKLGWLTEPILAKVKELGVEERVTFTGYVADDDLPALISAADVLAMPSKYEGFGLPVLEAMACGTPVVASNTSSLPEVGGEAALYARPDDVRSWAQLIDRVLSDAELRASLRDKGFKQAAKFKWSTMARETAEVYRAVSRTSD